MLILTIIGQPLLPTTSYTKKIENFIDLKACIHQRLQQTLILNKKKRQKWLPENIQEREVIQRFEKEVSTLGHQVSALSIVWEE